MKRNGQLECFEFMQILQFWSSSLTFFSFWTLSRLHEINFSKQNPSQCWVFGIYATYSFCWEFTPPTSNKHHRQDHLNKNISFTSHNFTVRFSHSSATKNFYLINFEYFWPTPFSNQFQYCNFKVRVSKLWF